MQDKLYTDDYVVTYTLHPAEPDVGLLYPYWEVTAIVDWDGNCIFNDLNEHDLDIIDDMIYDKENFGD